MIILQDKLLTMTYFDEAGEYAVDLSLSLSLSLSTRTHARGCTHARARTHTHAYADVSLRNQTDQLMTSGQPVKFVYNSEISYTGV